MELRKILFRKEMKLVTLLLTAMLIASASAAVYYSLDQTSTITIAGTEVWFEAGSDNATGTVVVVLNPQKTVVTVTGLKAYPNATQTYENTTMVHNNGSQTYQVRLRHVSLTQNSTEFEYIKFTLNATIGNVTLTYTSDGSSWTPPSAPTGWVNLSAGEDAPIIIETKARDNATAGGSATIEMKVDVQ